MTRKAQAVLLLLLLLSGGGCDRPAEPEVAGPAAGSASRQAEAEPARKAPAPIGADSGAAVLSRLESPDEQTRLAACRAVGEEGADPAAVAAALAPCAIGDPSEEVRAEAVRALGRMKAPEAIEALATVVADGEPSDAAWKRATYAFVDRAPQRQLLRVVARKMLRQPEASVLLIEALRRAEPGPMVKAFLLDQTAGDDVTTARVAAECLFSYADRAPETFERAVRNVMPRLEGHGRKLAFARPAAKTQTLEGAGALARCAADSDDPDDWRAVVEVFRKIVRPEHQESFGEIRDIAVKVTDWRFQIEVRKLIRQEYAGDLIVKVNGESLTFDAVWTREDLLDWEMVQRRARRRHAIFWVSPLPRQFEIAVVETPKDYLLLDEARRVVEVHRGLMARGVQSPPDIMYALVLPEGTADRAGVSAGDVIEFDEELVHALSEMELQEPPPDEGS
jgi:hypothetical protein